MLSSFRRWRNRRRSFRLTGISTPVGGVSWEFSNSEREVVRQLMIFIEDRAVLAPAPPLRDPYRLLRSVDKIAAAATEAIQQLPENSQIAETLRQLRGSCRLGHIDVDGQASFLFLIGAIREQVLTQLVVIADAMNLELPADLRRTAANSPFLKAFRDREDERRKKLESQMERLEHERRKIAEARPTLPRGYPNDLLYHAEHTWVRRGSIGLFVGLTNFAQDALGEFVHLDLPQPGEVVQRGGRCGDVESVKAIYDIVAPISGHVIGANPLVIDRPELVNEDPYVAGWLLVVDPADEVELAELLSAQEYVRLVG
jgi:glycine cleavage system H protein